MNEFTRMLEGYFGAAGRARLAEVKVGIAGAGGLGSNCAAMLVRSGFTRLRIYDFDRVECSNLNRQFYFHDQIGRPKVEALRENLRRINPDLQPETICERITAENVSRCFADCDIVIEAFDCAEAKKMLAKAYLGTGKLYITASGLAGWGNSDNIRINKLRDSLYLVGDDVSEAGNELPPLAPRVNIAAAKEADIALTWTLEKRNGSELE